MMKNNFVKSLICSLVLVLFVFYGFGQSGLKVRIAANSGSFMSEPGSADAITDPFAIFVSEPGGVADFSSDLTFGIEAEISMPISDKLRIGAELENSKMSGYNENPIFYNYFASAFTPLLNYNQEPLIYNTEMVNALANIYLLPLGHNTFAPFVKVFGGVSMVGTDLRFQDPENQTNIADPLYSRGTSLSVSDVGKFVAPHFGAGAGFEYQVTGNISIFADISVSYIDTDIINGVPNFSYNEENALSEYFDISTVTRQFSVGLCYALSSGSGFSSKGGSGKSKSGKTDSSLPFFRRK